jgi:hypothetical protein
VIAHRSRTLDFIVTICYRYSYTKHQLRSLIPIVLMGDLSIKVVHMIRITSDSLPASDKNGVLPLVGPQTPARVLVAYKFISSLSSLPSISRAPNVPGSDFYRMRFGRGRRNRRSLYLGRLDEPSRRLLNDCITNRRPKELIRELTCTRNALRRRADELAIGSGFRFRGHEVERRKPAKQPDKNLVELLATLRRLREVDEVLHQRLASSLNVMSPREAKRTRSTLRMLSRAKPLTDRSIGKVSRVLRRELR